MDLRFRLRVVEVVDVWKISNAGMGTYPPPVRSPANQRPASGAGASAFLTKIQLCLVGFGLFPQLQHM